MFRNKSDVETPWDSFVTTMNPVLKRVSRGFRMRHNRTLALGSAARVDTERGEVIRIPIEVRGGEREYAVATLLITNALKRHYDVGRLEDIARAALAAAEEHPIEPPAKPGQLVLSYP